LYFSAGEKGSRIIHYYDLKSGQSKKITKEGGMAGLSSVSAKNIAFSWNTPNTPSELYVANLDGSNARRVTFETDEWLKGKTLSKTEDFWFPSFDGVMVHGFISYPANVKAGDKLPVIHRIHGGPHGMYGFSFTDLNEVLVAKGYAVVFLNPRGLKRIWTTLFGWNY
jgi:dipeptidyl aminopeptidase/acylaminoacyl peptidase